MKTVRFSLALLAAFLVHTLAMNTVTAQGVVTGLAKPDPAVVEQQQAEQKILKQATELLNQARNTFEMTPARHGTERLKRLEQTLKLLEEGKKVLEQVKDDNDTLRIVLLQELAMAHKRFVCAEDGINELVFAAESFRMAQEELQLAQKVLDSAAQPARQAAQDQFDQAKQRLQVAGEKLSNLKEHAKTSEKYFREVEDRMRRSSDWRLGPNSLVLGAVFGVHAHLLSAKGEDEEAKVLLDQMYAIAKRAKN